MTHEHIRSASSLFLAVLLGFSGCATTPTVQDEREMAKQIERQVRAQKRVLHDRVVDNYIDEIGDRLLLAAGPQALDFSFTVIEDEVPNAFANFGGAIFVHTGLILAARNVSELAGVLGHEVGHVTNRHVAQKFAEARNLGLLRQVAVIGTAIATGSSAAGNAADALTGYSLLAYMNNFGREAERESDEFAVRILPIAGYDPTGVIDFFQTMKNMGGGAGSVPQFLRSHPTEAERVQAARDQIAAMDLPPNLRKYDGGRFEIIQHRIRLLTGADEDDRRDRRN